MAQLSLPDKIMSFTDRLYNMVVGAYQKAHTHTNLRALNDPTELRQWLGIIGNSECFFV